MIDPFNDAALASREAPSQEEAESYGLEVAENMLRVVWQGLAKELQEKNKLSLTELRVYVGFDPELTYVVQNGEKYIVNIPVAFFVHAMDIASVCSYAVYIEKPHDCGAYLTAYGYRKTKFSKPDELFVEMSSVGVKQYYLQISDQEMDDFMSSEVTRRYVAEMVVAMTTWLILHELGHVVLDHLDNPKSSSEMEMEADIFVLQNWPYRAESANDEFPFLPPLMASDLFWYYEILDRNLERKGKHSVSGVCRQALLGWDFRDRSPIISRNLVQNDPEISETILSYSGANVLKACFQ